MRNEQHPHLSLELVDGPGKVFRRMGIQAAGRLVKDQQLGLLE
jgi:hypothetical protein